MVTKEDLAKAILDLNKSQKEMGERLEKSQNETNEQRKKTEATVEKVSKQIGRVSKLVGNISNNQGDIAEEFFYNSISANPTLNGIDYDFTDKNITRKRFGIEDEFDMVLIDGKDVAIIETKYKAHSKDVIKLVTKKLENFKILYPEYKDYSHHLALASFHINDDVKKEAKSNNVILLQRKGDLIETI
ncbi:MAG: hypothetical protein U9N33_11315 [Campylobacterota bacterium]|nr:hypothetical protein [Campylobacterota bacterium]